MNSECGKSLEFLLNSLRPSDTALDDDDCEVEITEKPPDFIHPTRKRGNIFYSISSLNDGCNILDCNIEKIVYVSETIGNYSQEYLVVTARRDHVWFHYMFHCSTCT